MDHFSGCSIQLRPAANLSGNIYNGLVPRTFGLTRPHALAGKCSDTNTLVSNPTMYALPLFCTRQFAPVGKGLNIPPCKTQL